MNKLIYCVLVLVLSIGASVTTLAQPTSSPARQTTHSRASKSRKAYLKQQKKKQKKLRKEQKRSQKHLEKLHKSAH